jgi:hypothetical protein
MESSDNERGAGRAIRNWCGSASGGDLPGLICAHFLRTFLCRSMSLSDVTRWKATAHEALCYVMSVTKRVRVPSGPPYFFL